MKTNTKDVKSLRKSQHGLTLMELIAGLAIVGSVIVGALALFGTTSSQQKSTQLLSDVQSMRSTVKQLWGRTGSYGAGAMNATLINSGRLPSTITNPTGAVLTHVMNGNVTVQGAGSQFTITLTNVDNVGCTSLLTASNDWINVTVNGTAVANYSDPAQASASCQAANTVIFSSN